MPQLSGPIQMELDLVIHQPIRLKIMSVLSALPRDDRLEFSSLRRFLAVTDGNLGAHLRKLAESGYIETRKRFVDGKPRTDIRISPSGRQAFIDHVRALESIILGPAPSASDGGRSAG